MGNFRIHIVANCIRSADTLSGGERIFIELSRRWAQMGYEIIVYTDEEGRELMRRQKLDNVSFEIWTRAPFRNTMIGVASFYLAGTLRGLKYVQSKVKRTREKGIDIVCSISDFWSSSIPGWAMARKLNAPWVASFFLFSPHPWASDTVFPRWKTTLFYLSQLPIYRLTKWNASMVFVTNDLDRYHFQNKRLSLQRIIAVMGGVDIKMTDAIPEPSHKEFDALFIGRFHPQKGVLELVDIWQRVCQKKPGAHLAMIGNGELEESVARKVIKLGLHDNITLLGFMDGPEKIKVFKSSRIVVHPARYDSGGQAAAEAMACSLPGVSFDLPALKVYYPRGMLKIPPFNLEMFAKKILALLDDTVLYQQMAKEAREYALEWDWDKRANSILQKILELTELDE